MTNCTESINKLNKFHNVGSHECRSGCTGSFRYYKVGGDECYESCDLIPGIGKNYIIKPGNICDCALYADDTDEKVCYNNEEECLNKGYKYKLGQKCIKDNCPFKVEDDIKADGSEKYLQKCFESETHCSNNKFYYYNKDSKTCWASCPDNMYSNPLNSNGKPEEDNSGNTCTSQCTDPYFYKSEITKTCKKKCDPGEYVDEVNKECLSSCNKNFIGENNECLSGCTNPYYYKIEYPDTTKKTKCVSRCANYGKYYSKDIYTCKDTCASGTNYPYFYNSDNRCLLECNDTTINNKVEEKYNYVDSKLLLQPCLNDTEKNKLYYYSGDYNVYNTCDIFKTIDSHECSDCNGKFVYKNYCVDKCPLEAPYYVNKSYTLSHKKGKPSIYISKCVAKCTDEEALLEELNTICKSKYDFFYLPLDNENECNLGYAFINFVHPLHIVHFYHIFKARKWNLYKSNKECDLSFAKFQGKAELTANLDKNMNKIEDKKKLPMVFETITTAKIDMEKKYFDEIKNFQPDKMKNINWI